MIFFIAVQHTMDNEKNETDKTEKKPKKAEIPEHFYTRISVCIPNIGSFL